MMKRAFLLALLLGFSLLLSPAARAADDAVRLFLGPVEEPVDYWIRTESTELVRKPGGEEEKARTDVLDLVERFVYQAPGGRLLVIADVLGREDVLGGTSLDEDRLESYEYHLTPRGQRVDLAQGAGLELGLMPKLPADPVRPGHEWRTRAGEAQGLPFPVVFRNVFLGVEEVLGTRCVLIESLAEGKGEQEQDGRRTAARVKIVQGLAIGAEDGMLVKMATLLRSKSLISRGGTPVARTVRQVYRILQRRLPGDVEVPGAYEGSDLAGEAGSLEAMEGP